MLSHIRYQGRSQYVVDSASLQSTSRVDSYVIICRHVELIRGVCSRASSAVASIRPQQTNLILRRDTVYTYITVAVESVCCKATPFLPHSTIPSSYDYCIHGGRRGEAF